MKKRIKSLMSLYCVIGVCFVFSSCGTVEKVQSAGESETNVSEEDVLQAESEAYSETEEDVGMTVPSKEEVLAMRAVVLKGMSEEEVARLTENIKIANLAMESAYLSDNIFNKLSDPNSPYWQYFDKSGDIQLGWWYKRQIVDKDTIMRIENITEAEFNEREYEPGIEYNRFDAGNFIEIIEDMQVSVQDEKLRADMQQLIDLTYMAAVTHEMEYANQIYKILHDLDYYLLRYGMEDVGVYMQDASTVSNYYGVLNVYGATPFMLNEENSYHVLYSKIIESDPSTYGDMEAIHEDFLDKDGNISFYYDMDCFYFDDTFPSVLNETLRTYYNSIEESYIKDSQVYTTGTTEGNAAAPYDSLIFQYFTYVGDDYVSLVYNDVSYMGGAHPYSALDGITIDCTTGEMVPVQQFLDDSDKKIGEHLQQILGLASDTIDGWDYYITDISVVFFYYDPRYWDSVAARRVR